MFGCSAPGELPPPVSRSTRGTVSDVHHNMMKTHTIVSEVHHDISDTRAMVSERDVDPHTNFWAIYKRETDEYEATFVKKCDEDLNTLLIFVRHVPFAPMNYLSCPRRRVCSLPSLRPLSSKYSPSSNQITTNGRKPTYEQFSSASTNPFLPAKTLQLPQRGMVPPPRSSRFQAFSMQAL